MLARTSWIAAALLLAACSTPPAPLPPPPAEKPMPATANFSLFTYEGSDSVYEAVAGKPDTFRNPILQGYYPDPSILRVGEDYYLVNSTFTYFPGLPVFKSKDLVGWTQIGNAIDRPSQINLDKLRLSRGLYAPAISYHAGTFYIVNTCVDCGGNFYVTATNPAGPWSDPVWLPFEGIDPSLFFDKNGRSYIVNNGLPDETPRYEGHRAIWMQEIDLTTGKMIGPRHVIVNGGTDIKKRPIWIEGPHLFHAKGWYYLICAEGGTAEQHSEVVFRSKKLWGPFVPYKANPILTQRDLDPARPFPVTSTGHAQLVATPKGKWWAVFLGTRPYQGDFYNTGRETFLLPVTWKNGWPMILPEGKPVPYAVKAPPLNPGDGFATGNFGYAELFDKTTLGPEWIMLRQPHESWYSVSERSLHIKARPDMIGGLGQPSFIGRRQQHSNAAVGIELSFDPKIDGERAGLVALQDIAAFYFLGVVRENGTNAVCVYKRASKDEPENGVKLACSPAPSGKVWLKIAVKGGSIDFFSGPTKDSLTPVVTNADATILSTKKAGGFIGTVIGPYAYTP